MGNSLFYSAHEGMLIVKKKPKNSPHLMNKATKILEETVLIIFQKSSYTISTAFPGTKPVISPQKLPG